MKTYRECKTHAEVMAVFAARYALPKNPVTAEQQTAIEQHLTDTIKLLHNNPDNPVIRDSAVILTSWLRDLSADKRNVLSNKVLILTFVLLNLVTDLECLDSGAPVTPEVRPQSDVDFWNAYDNGYDHGYQDAQTDFGLVNVQKDSNYAKKTT